MTYLYQVPKTPPKLQLRREPKDPSFKHFWVSIIKSAVRIVGYGFLPFNIFAGALVLILAEALGILEEL